MISAAVSSGEIKDIEAGRFEQWTQPVTYKLARSARRDLQEISDFWNLKLVK